MTHRSRLAAASAITLVALALVGCTPISSTRGNIIDDERLAKVTVGDSRDEVFQALGSPTVTGTFNDRRWYYVGQRSEQTAFFAPDVVERRLIAVTFTETDTVASIEDVGFDQAAVIEPVERTTPTAGRTLSFLEQVFGNVGR